MSPRSKQSQYVKVARLTRYIHEMSEVQFHKATEHVSAACATSCRTAPRRVKVTFGKPPPAKVDALSRLQHHRLLGHDSSLPRFFDTGWASPIQAFS